MELVNESELQLALNNNNNIDESDNIEDVNNHGVMENKREKMGLGFFLSLIEWIKHQVPKEIRSLMDRIYQQQDQLKQEYNRITRNNYSYYNYLYFSPFYLDIIGVLTKVYLLKRFYKVNKKYFWLFIQFVYPILSSFYSIINKEQSSKNNMNQRFWLKYWCYYGTLKLIKPMDRVLLRLWPFYDHVKLLSLFLFQFMHPENDNTFLTLLVKSFYNRNNVKYNDRNNSGVNHNQNDLDNNNNETLLINKDKKEIKLIRSIPFDDNVWNLENIEESVSKSSSNNSSEHNTTTPNSPILE
ncbi:hypothetical protein K502DRAFT_239742 [Neoconidiobolus thromboides FSU 785]|nr:hypothetical protein K502DRAFT_239742 [Neoconidiobolus thromboides FSU 785]